MAVDLTPSKSVTSKFADSKKRDKKDGKKEVKKSRLSEIFSKMKK